MAMLQRVVNRARRRALMDQALRSSIRGSIAGLAIALALLAVDRIAGLSLPALAFAFPPLAGLLVGLIVAIVQRPSRFDAAVQLDRRLGLKDRVGTAESIRLGLIPQAASVEFAALAQRDAQSLADRIDVRAAMPIRLDRAWTVAALGALMLIAGIRLLPTIDWSTSAGQTGPSVAAPVELIDTQTTIARTINETTKALADVPLDEPAQEQLAALDRLAEQLNSAQPSEPEIRQARDETAARLDDVADQMDRQARRDLAAADEVAQRFSGLAAADAPMSAEQFSQALRRGDFGAAAETLEKVLADPDALTETQRQELADHLRHLREQLDRAAAESLQPAQAAQPPSDSANDRREQLRQALHDQGLDDERIDKLLNENSQAPQTSEAQEQKLREQGVDEDVARRLAEELEQLKKQQQTQREAQRQSQRLADALEQAARDLTEPQDESPQQTPQEPQSDQSPKPDEKRSDDSTSQPADQSKSGDARNGSEQQVQPSTQPGAKPSPAADPNKPSAPQSPTQPGAQTPKPDATTPKPEPGATQGEKKGDQPGQKPDLAPSPNPNQKPGAQPASKPDSQPGDKAGDQPGQERATEPGQKPGAKPTPTPVVQPGPSTGSRPDETRVPVPDENQPDQSGETPSSAPAAGDDQRPPDAATQPGSSISKMLRDLANRKQSAQRRQADSESLRKAARELAQKLTPEERREMERWAKSAAAELRRDAEAPGSPNRRTNEPGTLAGAQTEGTTPPPDASPASTHDIDLRDNDVGDQVIAQWLGRETPSDASATSGQIAQGVDPIRSAQRQAERAVNESSVPSRYHRYIRRFFGRLDQTAERAAPNAAPTSTPAPTAPQANPATPPSTPPPAGDNPS